MKIYEKPMALIEKIEVEDVITTSVVIDKNDANATALSATEMGAIVFEW